MAAAETLCDRVAIMLHGRIVTVASPAELTATGSGLTTVSVRTTDRTLDDLDAPGRAHEETVTSLIAPRLWD
jgi:ABC-2 type transport system ATP-binding protein